MKNFKVLLAFCLAVLFIFTMAVFPQTAYAAYTGLGSWQGPIAVDGYAYSAQDVGDPAMAAVNGKQYIVFANKDTGALTAWMRNPGIFTAHSLLDKIPSGNPKEICLKASNGCFYLAYIKFDGSEILVYKNSDASLFNWELMGSPLTLPAGAEDLRLVVDNGTPYIAFANSSYEKLVYKFNESSGFQMLGLPRSGANNTALGFDVSGGIPYMAYYNGYYTTIVKFNGSISSWEPIPITTNPDNIHQIAVDTSGNIYALCDMGSGLMGFIQYNSVTGAAVFQDTFNSFSLDSAIAIHGNDVYVLSLNPFQMPNVCWFNGKALYILNTGSIPASQYGDLAIDGDIPYLSVTNTTATADLSYYKFLPSRTDLSASAVTVTNNKGTADTVTVTGLSQDARVKVYSDSTGQTLLGTGVLELNGDGAYTATLSITQLTQGPGNVYIGVCQGGYFENIPLQIPYHGEPCTITFDLQGGTLDPAVPGKTVYYGEAYGALPAPTITGYTLGGWFTAVDGGGDPVTDNTTVNLSANQALFAKWTANTYTVNYDGNGGDGGTTAASTHAYDAEKALTANGYTKAGYLFAGWALDKDGPVKYGDSQSVKNLTADKNGTVTLYAKWAVNTYSVAFDAQGGTVDPPGKNISFGETYGALPTPQKAGYAFGGWFTEANGGGTQVTESTVFTQAAGLTLYAKWTRADYAITYDLKGGAVAAPNPTAYSVESEAFTLVNPTKAGCNFAGWTGTGINGAAMTVSIPKGSTGDRAYTATWTPTGTYAVKASVNNKKYGKVTGARTCAGGDTVSLTAVPASGYRFVKWTEGKKALSPSPAVYSFTVTKARTLTANFAEIGTPKLSSAKASVKGGIRVAWKSVSGAKGYYVYRAASKSGKYSKIKAIDGELKFTDTGLKAGKTYYYKVRAYCQAGTKITTGGSSKVLSAKVK
jgi:uncharacterized repeat protein (TIGR02543 family)